MTEDMKKWLEMLSSDEELRNGLMEVNDAPRDEAVRILIGKASEMGLTLTEDDFASPENGELSDDELDAVAGGGGCGCPGIGGGAGESGMQGWKYKCGCVFAGIGHDEEDPPEGCYRPTVHCVCPTIGGGTDDPIV